MLHTRKSKLCFIHFCKICSLGRNPVFSGKCTHFGLFVHSPPPTHTHTHTHTQMLYLLNYTHTHTYIQEWSAIGVEQHWFSTIDFQPPSLTSIRAGIKVIDAVKARRDSVYVHCKAGKGRSTTMVACFVIKVIAIVFLLM